ncbi:MAG: hypothetical protein ACRD9R_00645 [Pyrinomonadaceae bacterium]
MELIPCRDCQTMISTEAKGCPRCGRNLMAERMLGKYLWLVLVPAVAVLGVLCVWLLSRAAL